VRGNLHATTGRAGRFFGSGWSHLWSPGGHIILPSDKSREENARNNTIAQFAMISRKVNRQHIQLLFAIAALAMLVLGVGAPSDGGGSGRGM